MRKLLIALLAVALLAGYYLLGTGYLDERRENGALAAETSAAQQALALVPPRPPDLDRRLEEALAAEEAARLALPERLNTTRTLDAVLRLAEDTGVKAIPLITQPWTVETIGGQDYSVFRFDLTVTGDFAGMEDFLSKLETGAFETLVVEYLRVATPEEPEGAQVESNLRVTIYARPER